MLLRKCKLAHKSHISHVIKLMSYFAIFQQGLTLAQTSLCKSLDFFEVTFSLYEPYLKKNKNKNAELKLVSESMG